MSSATLRQPIKNYTAPRALTARRWTKAAGRLKSARKFESRMFGGLIAILIGASIPYGAAQAWWEATFQAAIFLCLAVWMTHGLISGAWGVRGQQPIIAACLIAGFAWLQSQTLWTGEGATKFFASADVYASRMFAWSMLSLAAFAALLWRYAADNRRRLQLMYAVLAVGAGSAVFGIVRATTQDATGDSGFGLSGLTPAQGFGQFINRNHFAFLMEMTLGLSLGMTAASRMWWQRTVFGLSAILVWAALVWSNSRGGIVGMLVMLIAFALLLDIAREQARARRRKNAARQHESLPLSGVNAGNKVSAVNTVDDVDVTNAGNVHPASLRNQHSQLNKKQHRHSPNERQRWRVVTVWARRGLLIISLLTFVFIGTAWVGGDSLAQRFGQAERETELERRSSNHNLSRAQIWAATLAAFNDNPLTGIGFGGYAVAISHYFDSSGASVPRAAHNDYLEMLASGGIIGAALWAWLATTLVQCARDAWTRARTAHRQLLAGAHAGLAAIAAHSLFDFGLHIPANAYVGVALLVIVTSSASAVSIKDEAVHVKP